MIAVFTTNKDGKIELTKDELKKLLDDAYWEGYKAHVSTNSWTYSSPSWACSDSSTTSTTKKITLNSNTTK